MIRIWIHDFAGKNYKVFAVFRQLKVILIFAVCKTDWSSLQIAWEEHTYETILLHIGY